MRCIAAESLGWRPRALPENRAGLNSLIRYNSLHEWHYIYDRFTRDEDCGCHRFASASQALGGLLRYRSGRVSRARTQGKPRFRQAPPEARQGAWLIIRITFARSARKELEKLPSSIAQRIIARIEALMTVPRPSGAVKLHGNKNLWRIGIGDYRAIYSIDDAGRVIDISAVRNRRDAYHDL